MTGQRLPPLLVPVLLVVACMAPLALLPSLRDGLGAVLACGLLASAAHAWLVQRAFSRRHGPPRRADLAALAAGAIGLRLLLLVPAEGLSDDLYRYLWEGRVVLAGHDPWRHAPQDPVLADLRDERIWPRVNHPDVPAAYPPLAQAAFAGLAAATGSPRGVRAAMAAADLLAAFFLSLLLRARGQDPRRAAVFALSPLVGLSFAGSGHYDAMAVAATLLAFLLQARGRPAAAALGLAGAALVKPFALFLLPFLLVRGRRLVQLFGFAAAFGLGALPWLHDAAGREGLRRYALEWHHNAPLYPAAVALVERAKAAVVRRAEQDPEHDELRARLYAIDPNRLARQALGAAFAVAFALIVLRFARRGPEVSDGDGAREVGATRVLVALLLCSPTVHPWYLTWWLPFLAAAARGPSPPLLLWSGTALLAHHPLAGLDLWGFWREERWLRAAEYAPVLAWLAWRAWRAGTRSGRE